MESKKEGFAKNKITPRNNMKKGVRKDVKKEEKRTVNKELTQEKKVIIKTGERTNSKSRMPRTTNTRKKMPVSKEEGIFKKEKLKIIPLRWSARSWKKYYCF